MSKKKTHEEYVAELAVKNPNVEVIGQYINSTTKIEHHCLIHDIYWYMFPNNALRGCGCVKCGAEQSHIGFSKTHEEYVDEIKNKGFNIVVLESYKNAKTPILHRCNIDGYEWISAPTSVLNSQGCPECSKRNGAKLRLKTHEQYIQEVSVKMPTIDVVEKYIDSHTKILHHCSTCDYYWEAKPNNILNGCGCPMCAGTVQKTHDEYIKQVALINPDIIVLGKYINAKMPILHKCKLDGNEWNATPDKILHGQGCPQCNESQGERNVRQWLESHNIKYVFQKTFSDCRDINLLPFDFYLPNHNMIIEYDGKQHYEPVGRFGGEKGLSKTQKHDKIKTEYCQNNNIRLLRIPYYKNVDSELNNSLFI